MPMPMQMPGGPRDGGSLVVMNVACLSIGGDGSMQRRARWSARIERGVAGHRDHLRPATKQDADDLPSGCGEIGLDGVVDFGSRVGDIRVASRDGCAHDHTAWGWLVGKAPSASNEVGTWTAWPASRLNSWLSADEIGLRSRGEARIASPGALLGWLEMLDSARAGGSDRMAPIPEDQSLATR